MVGLLLGALGADAAAAPELVTAPPEPATFMLSDRLSGDPDALWPKLPQDHELSMDDRMVDNLSDWTNRVMGAHIDKMSHDLVALHVDMRAGRARLRLGMGDGKFLKFRFDSDWHFIDGKARMTAKLDLGVSGHMLHVDVPAVDVSTDSYRGQDLVQVNVPLLQRTW